MKTAKYFNISIGLLSENLKLAKVIHKDPAILLCPSREDALRKIRV